jgi:hypothetical protein
VILCGQYPRHSAGKPSSLSRCGFCGKHGPPSRPRSSGPRTLAGLLVALVRVANPPAVYFVLFPISERAERAGVAASIWRSRWVESGTHNTRSSNHWVTPEQAPIPLTFGDISFAKRTEWTTSCKFTGSPAARAQEARNHGGLHGVRPGVPQGSLRSARCATASGTCQKLARRPEVQPGKFRQINGTLP